MLKNVVLVMRMADKGSDEFWKDSERQLKGFVPEVATLLKQQDVRRTESPMPATASEDSNPSLEVPGSQTDQMTGSQEGEGTNGTQPENEG